MELCYAIYPLFQGCSTVEVVQSVSEVLNLQQLIEQNDVIQMFGAFSDIEPSSGQGGGDGNSDCEHALDKYIHHFCGDLREEPSSALRGILSRSCYGDSYQKGKITSRIYTVALIIFFRHTANHEKTGLDNSTGSSSNSDKNSLKILYTPYTNLTLSIIKKANRTFESVGLVIGFAAQVANCSEYFLDNFPPESFATVRSVCKYCGGFFFSLPCLPPCKVLSQVIEYREGGGQPDSGSVDVTSLFPNVSLDSLLKAQELLNVSAPNNIWSIMTTVHNVSVGISEGLAKFDWDVFVGMEDESELEALAGDYARQDDMGITYVAAGIVFEPDLPSNLKQTTVKIRTNFSSVVDTSEYKEKCVSLLLLH